VYFEIYSTPRSAGAAALLGGQQWRWRLCGGNHEIIASGESYTTREACEHAIGLVKGTTAFTPVLSSMA
jgi:uncharacterized protein YegP (UPF0339 family)